MNMFTAIGTRLFAQGPIFAAVLPMCYLCLTPLPAYASPAVAVVRVEEDWELRIDSPDAKTTAPQITCTFSPNGNVDSVHATLAVNHQSLPEFVPGGIQLQIWDGEREMASKKFPNESVLSTANEIVRWTQAIAIENGQILFEIENGSSTTWGQFGGQGYLKATTNTTLQDLNAYNPKISVDQSGVGYAANRVKVLVLKEVRYYMQSGEVFRDTAERVVHLRD
jgi:hypothetical protein